MLATHLVEGYIWWLLVLFCQLATRLSGLIEMRNDVEERGSAKIPNDTEIAHAIIWSWRLFMV